MPVHHGAQTLYIAPAPSIDALIGQLQGVGLLRPGIITRKLADMAALATQDDGALRSGEFDFPADISMREVFSILRHGPLRTRHFTIPEGSTSRAITSILNTTPGLTGTMPSIREGSVYPSTYSYFSGQTYAQLLGRMEREMNTRMDEAWDRRDQKALDGVINTPQELLILASLVERESALTSERPLIAGVFINRLKRRMKLQTDPSVVYAWEGATGMINAPLTHESMKIDSPYNTYMHAGLPPGPICAPGAEALNAAAHPARHAYLYFLADKGGAHIFSTNYERHMQRIQHLYRRAIQDN